MKPVNSNKEGCSPISSNCVIWQGPDIECINLCKGDTVTDVVYQLATELCTILDQTNVDVYDLSCLNLLQQDPADFQKLIQLLIDKICQLEGVEPGEGGEGGAASGCPDCLVNVASCLQETDPITGSLIIKEQLVSYVERIGAQICGILDTIEEIITDIKDINTTINSIQKDIEDIEASIPDPLPTVTPVCVTDDPGTSQDMDVVLSALEAEYCNLRTVTGSDANLLAALTALCNGLGTNLLTGSPIAGFISSPTTVADLLTNLALKVCDTNSALVYVLNTCCDTSCSAIDLEFDAEFLSPTEIRIIYSGSIPVNFIDNNPASTVQIIDNDTGLIDTIPNVKIFADYYDASLPQDITLAQANGQNNCTVKVTYDFVDPTTQQVCSSVVQTLVLGTLTCPPITVIAGTNSVTAEFTYTGPLPQTLVINVYEDMLPSPLVATTTIVATTAVQSVTLSNLTSNTDYNLELIIDGTPCPRESFTTINPA
jgi:hypothetical protein